MATEIDICNVALSVLGARTIVSLGEDSFEGDLCRTFYPQSRDKIMRSHTWNCATTRKSLNALLDAPLEMAGDFTKQFPIPPDSLRILELNFDDPHERWKIELSPNSNSKVILCNSPTLICKYIKQITDTSLFDSLLVEAIEFDLMGKLAIPIKGSEALHTKYMEMADAKIAEARTLDGMEGTTEAFQSNEILAARYQGVSYGDRRSGWI